MELLEKSSGDEGNEREEHTFKMDEWQIN